MARTSRKPIGFIALPSSDEEGHQDTNELAAICDDGAFFTYSFRDGEWLQHPGIPGTPGAVRFEAEEAAKAPVATGAPRDPASCTSCPASPRPVLIYITGSPRT